MSAFEIKQMNPNVRRPLKTVLFLLDTDCWCLTSSVHRKCCVIGLRVCARKIVEVNIRPQDWPGHSRDVISLSTTGGDNRSATDSKVVMCPFPPHLQSLVLDGPATRNLLPWQRPLHISYHLRPICSCTHADSQSYLVAVRSGRKFHLQY